MSKATAWGVLWGENAKVTFYFLVSLGCPVLAGLPICWVAVVARLGRGAGSQQHPSLPVAFGTERIYVLRFHESFLPEFDNPFQTKHYILFYG